MKNRKGTVVNGVLGRLKPILTGLVTEINAVPVHCHRCNNVNWSQR